MNLVDLIFISLPEFLAILMMTYLLLNKSISKKNLLYSTLIYLGFCYFIKGKVLTSIGPILVCMVFTILVYKFSKAKFVYCFVYTMISSAIRFILEWCSVIAVNLMGISLEVIMSDRLLKIFVCNISIIFMFIVTYLILKYKISKKPNKPKRSIIHINKDIEYIIILVNILIMLVLAIAIIIIDNSKSIYYSKNHLIAGFLIFSLIILLISLMLLLMANSKKKMLRDVERNLMEKNLKQMEDSIDLLRMQRHDYMNHLQVILMQVTYGKINDARNYILGLSKTDNSSVMYYNTGSSYMDAILNTKKRRASKYNIELTACIDSLLEDIELSDSELSSILLNIVDNAIDELKKYDRDDKYIHVDVYRDNNVHNVSIKNNGNKIHDTKKIFELGYSSKGKNRGYGLYSIKKLLESYNCSLEVYSDEIETEFIIQVPIMVNYTI